MKRVSGGCKRQVATVSESCDRRVTTVKRVSGGYNRQVATVSGGYNRQVATVSEKVATLLYLRFAEMSFRCSVYSIIAFL